MAWCSRALNGAQAPGRPLLVERRVGEVAGEVLALRLRARPRGRRDEGEAAAVGRRVARALRVEPRLRLRHAERQEPGDDVPAGRVAERLAGHGVGGEQGVEPGYAPRRLREIDERVHERLSDAVGPPRVRAALPQGALHIALQPGARVRREVRADGPAQPRQHDRHDLLVGLAGQLAQREADEALRRHAGCADLVPERAPEHGPEERVVDVLERAALERANARRIEEQEEVAVVPGVGEDVVGRGTAYAPRGPG